MGMSLSCPLVKEPESYNNPDYYEDSVQFIIGVELHEINLKFCHCMVRQRMRSRDETVKLRGFIMDWEATAKKLWKRYPDWTSNDLLNLLHLFELFDTNGKKLLRFKDFNECMDLALESSTPVQHRAMFDRADVHGYKCINFEEFLQLMHGARMRLPLPPAPTTTDNHDCETQDNILKVAHMDPIQQMCYGVF